MTSELRFHPENRNVSRRGLSAIRICLIMFVKSGTKVQNENNYYGVSEHKGFCNFVHPKKPTFITFRETVEFLIRIFDERSSVFHTRYQCFQLVEKPQDDSVTYASVVSQECEQFRLQEMPLDQSG